MKMFAFASCLLLSLGAMAGESGFVHQGKTYVVYKNGEKTGKTFEEMFPENNKRNPSAAEIPSARLPYMTFEEDDIARCYRYTGGPTVTSPIFCVRK